MPQLFGRQQAASTVAAVLAGLAFALAATALAISSLNPDTGYAMVVGRRLLGGERLYVDMVETNPPLFYWLMALPSLAGRLLHMPDDRMVGLFTGLTLVVCGLSA